MLTQEAGKAPPRAFFLAEGQGWDSQLPLWKEHRALGERTSHSDRAILTWGNLGVT